MSRALAGVAVLTCVWLLAAPADAQELELRAEGGASTMLTERYRDRFDWGGGGALRVGLSFFERRLEARLSGSAAFFPVESQYPGTLYTVALGARGALPLGAFVGGPWLDFDLGLGLTGELARMVVDVGAGWALSPADILDIGPFVRWTMIVQDQAEPIADHGHLLSFGVEVAIHFSLGGGESEPQVVEASDTDADGVSDAVDECPTLAEDRDGLGDADGCPEDDHDGDGIDDEQDTCPSAPESVNGYMDDDGCPDTEPPAPTTVTVTQAGPEPELMAQQVLFRVGTDRVSPRYRETIMEVCAVLAARPSTRVRVVGHADEQGTAAGNQRLGAARAGAVAEQLVLLCSLDPSRMETASYGDTQVACEVESDDCHERNRRVEFFLLTEP